MKTLSLCGPWNLHQKNLPQESWTAPVPGCVHDALLTAGKIPDPFYRYNERESQWIGTADWVYERDFEVTDDFLREENVVLTCEGLDTFATVFLNDAEIASTDNMFRTYRWDVRPHLRVGTNHLRVEFASVVPTMLQKSAERLLPAWNEPSAGQWWGINGRGYVRKQACQFGWDWGPMCVSAGIWRELHLEAWSQAKIEDWTILQDHAADGSVTVLISTQTTAKSSAGLRVRATLQWNGEPVASGEGRPGEKDSLSLHVAAPRLWWPNGLGEQPLYTLEIELLDAAGTVLDRISRRIGLRRLELIREPDAFGTSFVFAANGVRFFAKGSNWIPLDQYPSSQNPERYRMFLESAAEANMNMMRVWGGGYYSHDEFYDLCDELGICVWQDMMFGCGAYPTWDQAFMDNVYAETIDNVKRLRHRACLALWCGNNELEMGFCADEWSATKMSWESYFELFEKLIPSALAVSDPHTPYIPGSPHSSGDERKQNDSPKSGDLHTWEIWFSLAPFENYRNYPHRFVSEFGFQSFPEPRTVEGFTLPEDRKINSPVMEFHERSQPRVNMILHQTLDWFQLPENFNDTLWLSQLTHALGLKIGIEHWRRNWPQTSGATYWQLNDCWPAPTWASIDVHGRWKAPHYFAKRFFSPVLVSGLENQTDHTVTIHLTNDHPEAITGKLQARVTDLGGQTLLENTWTTTLSAISSQAVQTLALHECVNRVGKENILVWLEFGTTEKMLSSNLVHLARPKSFPLENPGLSFEVTEAKDAFNIIVHAGKPALWAWLELADSDCRFSDNFNAILPGQPWILTARPAQVMSIADFKSHLRLRSVFDTLH